MSQAEIAEIQAQMNQVAQQLLLNQSRKTCFGKCFAPYVGKFPDSMAKNDQICLAKCMDRMIEAHSIVVKASLEMVQNMPQDE